MSGPEVTDEELADMLAAMEDSGGPVHGEFRHLKDVFDFEEFKQRILFWATD